MSDEHFERLNNLWKQAQNNLWKQTQSYKLDQSSRIFSIFASLYIKSEQRFIGFNHIKSHPFYDRYKKNTYAIFAHAETHCLRLARKELTISQIRNSDTTLYVARAKRVHENGKWVWGDAKPCIGCWKCIKDHGIDTVVWTEEPKNYEVYDVRKN